MISKIVPNAVAPPFIILMKLIVSKSKPEMKLSQFPAHGYHFYLTRVLHFKAQKQFKKELGLSINLQTKLSSKRGVYGPTAAGRRSVLAQFQGMRVAFTDVSEPDSPHTHCY